MASALSIYFLALYLITEFALFKPFVHRILVSIFSIFALINVYISLAPGLVVVEYFAELHRAEYGPYRNLFAILLVFSWIIPLIAMFIYYPKSRGIQRFQLKFLIPSLFVTILFLFGTNLLLPTIIGSSNVSALGPIFISIYFAALFYSSFNYRLINVPRIIRGLGNITLKIAYVLAIYFFLDSIENSSFSIAFLVVIGAISSTVLKIIDRYTIEIDDSQQAYAQLEILLNTISKELNLIKLCSEIEDLSRSIFRGHTTSIIVMNSKSRTILYKSKNLRGLFVVNKLFHQWAKSDEHRVLTIEEVELVLQDPDFENLVLYKELHKFMTRNDIGLIAPLDKKVIINGVFMVSRKKEGIFSMSEIKFAESIANNCSVAISRAMLYKETRDFASFLEDTVSQRTIQLQQANAQLETLVTELKTVDQAKSEFISIASHQLRTPISIIRGYISMLLDGDFGPVPDEQKMMLGKAQQSVKQLINIVEDILNASRIEQGRLVITPEAFNVAELVKTVTSELKQKATKKGLSLDYISEISNVQIEGDRNKLLEVFMNIIDNGINYTKQGGIYINVEETKDKVLTSIKDSGIGIPKESQDKIFKRFSRLDNAKKVRPDGTGIGLYIAKTIVESHGGKIWFESKENIGTTFFIELPKLFPKELLPDEEDKKMAATQLESLTTISKT
ncbi:MAG: GAF domain-containing sensor histidine kinase [Candidatus Dojkabacteria bacterium]|nr:MAG: GAF domain-containing sensor histidine kinase [Candidatus Dojkabacteria bacterium]